MLASIDKLAVQAPLTRGGVKLAPTEWQYASASSTEMGGKIGPIVLAI